MLETDVCLDALNMGTELTLKRSEGVAEAVV